MGDSDVDTFANITRADYDFDDEAFETVTQNAKDFISSLLVHRKEDRLSAKQCLESIWLSQQNDDSSSKIRICTDKLKKFIIRRKWQVCINNTHFHIRSLSNIAIVFFFFEEFTTNIYLIKIKTHNRPKQKKPVTFQSMFV